jgi:hypothetical protein
MRAKSHDCFPDQWLGHGRPLANPPQAPNLTPLDSYLWDHKKISVLIHEQNRLAIFLQWQSAITTVLTAQSKPPCRYWCMWKNALQLERKALNSYYEILLCVWFFKWADFMWNRYWQGIYYNTLYNLLNKDRRTATLSTWNPKDNFVKLGWVFSCLINVFYVS